jgi:ribosomal-protein-serine acetyltransferase
MFAYNLGLDAELRLLENRHTEELFALIERNIEHLRPWMGWLEKRTTVDGTRKFIAVGLKKFAENHGAEVGIWYEKQLAGVIGFHAIDWPNKKTSIGYWLGAEFQGKGLMTRSCQTMIDYAFNELKLNRVEIECATANTRSRRIPERLGFQKEGVLRQAEWLYDHFVDHDLYSMLACEWQQAGDTKTT